MECRDSGKESDVCLAARSLRVGPRTEPGRGPQWAEGEPRRLSQLVDDEDRPEVKLVPLSRATRLRRRNSQRKLSIAVMIN